MGAIAPNEAAEQLERCASLVQQLRQRCISAWRLLDSASFDLGDFPAFKEQTGELLRLEDQLLREGSFEREIDWQSDSDLSRHERNLEVISKFEPWWRKFEAEVDSEISKIGETVVASSESKSGSSS